MKLSDANNILISEGCRDFSYLKEWGLSTIREAIKTVYNRKSSTKEDLERAEMVEAKILNNIYSL